MLWAGDSLSDPSRTSQGGSALQYGGASMRFVRSSRHWRSRPAALPSLWPRTSRRRRILSGRHYSPLPPAPSALPGRAIPSKLMRQSRCRACLPCLQLKTNRPKSPSLLTAARLASLGRLLCGFRIPLLEAVSSGTRLRHRLSYRRPRSRRVHSVGSVAFASRLPRRRRLSSARGQLGRGLFLYVLTRRPERRSGRSRGRPLFATQTHPERLNSSVGQRRCDSGLQRLRHGNWPDHGR